MPKPHSSPLITKPPPQSSTADLRPNIAARKAIGLEKLLHVHGGLAADIATRAGRESLYFYDAIAPIIDADSIDWNIVWRQSRYDKGEGADYANIPLDEEGYLAFVRSVVDGATSSESSRCARRWVRKPLPTPRPWLTTRRARWLTPESSSTGTVSTCVQSEPEPTYSPLNQTS